MFCIFPPGLASPVRREDWGIKTGTAWLDLLVNSLDVFDQQHLAQLLLELLLKMEKKKTAATNNAEDISAAWLPANSLNIFDQYSIQPILSKFWSSGSIIEHTSTRYRRQQRIGWEKLFLSRNHQIVWISSFSLIWLVCGCESLINKLKMVMPANFQSTLDDMASQKDVNLCFNDTVTFPIFLEGETQKSLENSLSYLPNVSSIYCTALHRLFSIK